MRAWVRNNLTFKEVSSDRDELNLRRCPICGDTGFHVYFNFSRKVGYCHKQECVFGFLKLIEEVHGPGVDLNKVVEILASEDYPVFEEIEDGQTRLEALEMALVQSRLSPVGGRDGSIPAGFVPFSTPDASKSMGHVHDYILSRGLSESEIYSGRWGTSTDPLLSDRVVTLIQDHEGNNVFWQARTIHDWVKPKYLYASKADTGLSASDVVARVGLLTAGVSIAVVNEGLYSALASDIPSEHAVGVAIFGSHFSSTQEARLISAEPKEVVLIQEPKVSSAKMLHRAMSFVKTGIPVSVLEMPEGDPNSHPELYRKLFKERKPV